MDFKDITNAPCRCETCGWVGKYSDVGDKEYFENDERTCEMCCPKCGSTDIVEGV